MLYTNVKTCDIKLFALEQIIAFIAKTWLLLHWELEGENFQISFCKEKNMNTLMTMEN
jgi:hypothetical protein